MKYIDRSLLSNISDSLVALRLRDRRSHAMFEFCLADNLMASLNSYVSYYSFIVEMPRGKLKIFWINIFVFQKPIFYLYLDLYLFQCQSGQYSTRTNNIRSFAQQISNNVQLSNSQKSDAILGKLMQGSNLGEIFLSHV